jgi:hypothetical protein
MVPISMNHGTAVVLSEPKSEVAQELVRFAQRFIPVTNKPKINSGDRRNHFSIWRK